MIYYHKNQKYICFLQNKVYNLPCFRGVAQSGRVLGLGPRCRRFESFRPDHEIQNRHIGRFFFCIPISSLSSNLIIFKKTKNLISRTFCDIIPSKEFFMKATIALILISVCTISELIAYMPQIIKI